MHAPPVCGYRFDPEVKNKPKKLPSGIFAWIGPVLFYDEDEALATAGMDVVVMARLLSYGRHAYCLADGALANAHAKLCITRTHWQLPTAA